MMAKPMVELLAQLQVHPILRCLALDGITTFVRLVAHLTAISFNHSQSTRGGEEVDIGWEGGGIMEGAR